MTTGEKISALRKKYGYKQEELAELLGVSRQAVSRWESDCAFPETEKLLKMSKLFDCSVDYLLKYDAAESVNERSAESGRAGNFLDGVLKWHYEYKSEKTVFGLPLVHINIGLGRTAKGFFAVGFKSLGVFAIGLLACGLFSFGALAVGLIALASLSLGFLSLGAVAFGIFALGGVAVGGITFGGLAVGFFAFGGCAVGGYSFGGYAYGSFVAIGDVARGGIALGGDSAVGTEFSATIEQFEELSDEIYARLDNLPPWLALFNGWCRGLFDGVLNGTIVLGGN